MHQKRAIRISVWIARLEVEETQRRMKNERDGCERVVAEGMKKEEIKREGNQYVPEKATEVNSEGD